MIGQCAVFGHALGKTAAEVEPGGLAAFDQAKSSRITAMSGCKIGAKACSVSNKHQLTGAVQP